MTIPAMATTTRELFGGAITAKLPKEYLDARWVDDQAELLCGLTLVVISGRYLIIKRSFSLPTVRLV